MLPTTRHVKELIQHAEEHLKSGSERDLKISLIHTDNSIEILLKEYLRYDQEKSWEEIERLNFYRLLSSCKDISLVGSSKSFFLAFHDMRNAVYHTGTLVPMKKDVNSIVDFAKTLFNELHPEFKFAKARIELPTERSIDVVSGVLGFQPHMTELSLMREVTEYLVGKGFNVYLEYPIDRARVDLFARKGADAIVGEIKIRRRGRIVGVDAVYLLKSYVDRFQKEFPEKNIEGWLMTNAGFSNTAVEAAKRFNIKLFDEERLGDLLQKKPDSDA